MIEVLILAAAQSRRDWLQRAIGEEPTIHVGGIAMSFPFLRSLMDEATADLILLDLESQSNSSSSQDWLLEFFDLVPAVLLSSVPDSFVFNRLLRTDSGALLRADASSEQIIYAIKTTVAGLLTFDPSLVPTRETDAVLSEDLTARETDVLHLLAEGLVNREIAGRLNISEHTIKFHIRSILAKLGASTRTEAVTRGLRSGLIEL